MRKKTVSVLSLIIILSTAVLSFIQWRYGIPFTFLASGSLHVSASINYPVPWSDRVYESDITVDLFENGKRIGESGSYINLPPGQYLVSFGDYNDTFETPRPQQITIKHGENTHIGIDYIARYGILWVTTELYNDYTETHTPIDADISIDGQWRGKGSLSIVFNEIEIEYHTVYFSVTSMDLEGYAEPYNVTAMVEKGKTTIVTCQLDKILTAEEQEYCCIRDKVRGLSSKDLDPDSYVINDKFFEWVLENKISVPVYFVDFGSLRMGTHDPPHGRLTYIIAQYAGILLDERINAFQNLYQSLLPAGINLLGSPPEHARHQSVGEMNYKDHPEKIFVVEVGYRLDCEGIEEVEGGEIYRYDSNGLTNVVSLFPNAIPAGISLFFESTKEVYISTNGLEKLTTVYPDFKEYSNLEEGDKGCYHATWKSLSVQSIIDFYFSDAISRIRQLISAVRIGTTLLDPLGFLQSIRLLI